MARDPYRDDEWSLSSGDRRSHTGPYDRRASPQRVIVRERNTGQSDGYRPAPPPPPRGDRYDDEERDYVRPRRRYSSDDDRYPGLHPPREVTVTTKIQKYHLGGEVAEVITKTERYLGEESGESGKDLTSADPLPLQANKTKENVSKQHSQASSTETSPTVPLGDQFAQVSPGDFSSKAWSSSMKKANQWRKATRPHRLHTAVKKDIVNRETIESLGYRVIREDDEEYFVEGRLNYAEVAELVDQYDIRQLRMKKLQSEPRIDVEFTSSEQWEICNAAMQNAASFESNVRQECWDDLPSELVEKIIALHRDKEKLKKCIMLGETGPIVSRYSSERSARRSEYMESLTGRRKYQATVEDDDTGEAEQPAAYTDRETTNQLMVESLPEAPGQSQALVRTKTPSSENRRIEIELPKETRAIFVAGEHGILDFVDAHQEAQATQSVPMRHRPVDPLPRVPSPPRRRRPKGIQDQGEIIALLRDISALLRNGLYHPEFQEQMPGYQPDVASEDNSDHTPTGLGFDEDIEEVEKEVKRITAPPKTKKKRPWKKRKQPKKEAEAIPS